MQRTASITSSAAAGRRESATATDVPAFLRSEEDAHATGVARALAQGEVAVGAEEGPDFLLDGADDMEC